MDPLQPPTSRPPVSPSRYVLLRAELAEEVQQAVRDVAEYPGHPFLTPVQENELHAVVVNADDERLRAELRECMPVGCGDDMVDALFAVVFGRKPASGAQ